MQDPAPPVTLEEEARTPPVEALRRFLAAIRASDDLDPTEPGYPHHLAATVADSYVSRLFEHTDLGTRELTPAQLDRAGALAYFLTDYAAEKLGEEAGPAWDIAGRLLLLRADPRFAHAKTTKPEGPSGVCQIGVFLAASKAELTRMLEKERRLAMVLTFCAYDSIIRRDMAVFAESLKIFKSIIVEGV